MHGKISSVIHLRLVAKHQQVYSKVNPLGLNSAVRALTPPAAPRQNVPSNNWQSIKSTTHVNGARYARCAASRMRSGATARAAPAPLTQTCRDKRTVRSNDQADFGAPTCVSRDKTGDLVSYISSRE